MQATKRSDEKRTTGGRRTQWGQIAIALFLLVLAACAGPAWQTRAEAAERSGTLEEMRRTVTVSRGGKSFELASGAEIYAFDTIRTGQIGSAVIRFVDDTVIEVGPRSEVVVTDATFSTKSARLLLRVARGDVRVRIGSIALKNPRGITLATPRNLITPSDGTLHLLIASGEERVTIESLPGTRKVSVYNTHTGDSFEIARPGIVLITDGENETTLTERDANR